jgi:hypothetical protein
MMLSLSRVLPIRCSTRKPHVDLLAFHNAECRSAGEHSHGVKLLIMRCSETM